MHNQNSTSWKIAGYLSLFLVSLLVFDSLSVIIGVGAALLALYVFSGKRSNPF